MKFPRYRSFASLAVAAVVLLLGASSAIVGVCGPFTDVSDAGFCPFVLEVFTLGITTGTTPTTYDPTSAVSRLQMAAFLSRSVDGVLKRGSRRAALGQFWTTQGLASMGRTTVGSGAALVQSDGVDLWVPNSFDGTVSRVRGSDGKLLETWTGAAGAFGALSAMGKVFVTEQRDPGNKLYRIDPSQAVGAVTTVASNLGAGATGIAFDGSRIWTSNFIGSISIVTPGAAIPWTVTTVTTGFDSPVGALYDGANIWITDANAGTLLKLNADGAILQTVTVGSMPQHPVFDGANIWVPNGSSNTVSVVRAGNGAVLATLTGNGLGGSTAAAFDGERILITNGEFLGGGVSLWKAADLSPIGKFFWVGSVYGACSDGINFWVTFPGNQLARF